MDLSVFDGDPKRLYWDSRPGVRTLIGIYQPGVGYLQEAIYSGISPPQDKEFEACLLQAKRVSRRAFSEESPTSIFIMLRRIRSRSATEDARPVAEYENGDLVAFCRPPWRKGKSLW